MSGPSAADIPLPEGDPPPAVFGGGVSQQSAISFSDIARKGQDVMSSTLQQYGPAMGHPVMPQHAQSFYPLHHHPAVPMSMPHIQPNTQEPTHPLPAKYNQIPQHFQPYRQESPIMMNNQQQYPQQPQRPTSVNYRPTVIPSIGLAQTPVYPISIPQSSLGTSSSTGPIVLPGNSATLSTTRPTAITQHPQQIAQISTSQAIVPSESVSPPLDKVASSGNVIFGQTSSDKTPACLPSSSTPFMEEPLQPEKQQIIKVVQGRCETYTLNQLIQEYRDIEKDMSEAQRNRATSERNLNNYMRDERGQNVEHNPKFIRLKEQKDKDAGICKELAEALKHVSEKLYKRFNYKISQLPRVEQPFRQKKQTVRMGTTPSIVRAPAPKTSGPPAKLDQQDDKRIMLDIKNSNLWCMDCDVHYSNLQEFSEHLHKPVHETRCNPTQPPWRTNLKQLSREDSYKSYKSICDKLSDKLRYRFTLQDLDRMLNPALNQDHEKLKRLNINRERGDFPEDDSLFTYKGYDLIVPVKGFYCKLCNKTLCDFNELDQHLKSYEHNSEHAKSIALNPNHEKVFRQNFEKSYKEQYGSDLKKSANKESSPKKVKEKDNDKKKSARNLLSDKPPISLAKSADVPSMYSVNLPFKQPYKKPTSRIVDEHDIIVDKFDKRDVSKPAERVEKSSESKSASEKSKDLPSNPPSLLSSSVPVTSSKDKEKEPEPVTTIELADDNLLPSRLSSSTETDDEGEISRRKLKKTKTNASVSKSSNKQILESDQDTDDVEILQESHLEPGDKDSPFPDLQLTIKGNVHHVTLKDPRLAQPLIVKLNRINLEDYKDMLFDESDLWSRVNLMMTKREPEEFKKSLKESTSAAASYFKPNGEAVPIEVDFDNSSSDDEKQPPFEMGMLETFFCEK